MVTDNSLIAVGLGAYLLLMAVVGLVAYRRVETSSDFMIADNNLGLVVSAGTFGATFVSAVGFIGLPALAYSYGYPVLLWGPVMWVLGVGLAVLVASRYRRTPMNTVPEFFRVRYGSKYLQAFSAFGLIYGISFALAAQIRGFGTILEGVLDVPIDQAVVIAVVVITLYTLLGGFYGVAWTDTIQWIVLSVGLFVVFLFVLDATGGWTTLHDSLAQISTAPVSGQAETPEGSLVRATNQAYPLPVILMGFFLWTLGIATHPQYAIRFQGAKDAQTAVRGVLLGCALAIPALLFSFVSGLGIRTLNPTMTAGSGADFALVYFLLNHTPLVVTVVVLGGALSAILSTSDSELLLVGSAFANDVWKNLVDPGASDRKLLIANRFATAVSAVLVCGIALSSSSLVANIGAYSWGVLAVFFFFPMMGGLYWKEANAAATWGCLVTGTATTVGWTALGLSSSTNVPSPVIALVLGGIVYVVVGAVTPTPPKERWMPFVNPTEHQVSLDDPVDAIQDSTTESD